MPRPRVRNFKPYRNKYQRKMRNPKRDARSYFLEYMRSLTYIEKFSGCIIGFSYVGLTMINAGESGVIETIDNYLQPRIVRFVKAIIVMAKYQEDNVWKRWEELPPHTLEDESCFLEYVVAFSLSYFSFNSTAKMSDQIFLGLLQYFGIMAQIAYFCREKFDRYYLKICIKINAAVLRTYNVLFCMAGGYSTLYAVVKRYEIIYDQEYGSLK